MSRENQNFTPDAIVHPKSRGDVAGQRERYKAKKTSEINEDLSQVLEKIFPETNYVSSIENPKTGELLTVIDINQIKILFQNEQRYCGVRISRRKILESIVEKFKDISVVTHEQLQKNDFQPKALFYIPKSLAEATSSLAIVDAEFHIAPWELAEFNDSRTSTALIQEVSDDKLSEFEAKFALTLFHPDYADARRGPDGKLYLKNRNFNPKDSNSKKRLTLSLDTLGQYNLSRILQTERSSGELKSRTVRDGMTEELPYLLINGEIKLEDFRELTLNDGEFNSEFSPKLVPKNGYVMLNGVNQYVGRRFEGRTVYPFTADKALIFKEEQGRRVLMALFNIVDKVNASDVYVGNDGRSVPRANTDKTSLKEIKYEDKIPVATAGLEKSLSPLRQVDLENEVTEAVLQLIESSRLAEEFVRNELVDADPVSLSKAIEKVRSDLMIQAERAIEMAAVTKNAASLKNNLKTFAYDARGYVSVLQAVGAEKMLNNPLEKTPAVELPDTDRVRMRELVHDNYKNESSEFQLLVAQSLEDHLGDSDTDFYILRNQNGLIISFNRFDKKYDPETGELSRQYFGSFNADPVYFGVGSIMMERTIKDQLDACPVLYAHCDPRAKISQKYIEDGFIGTQIVSPAGKFSFEIWRTKSSSAELKTKNMTPAALVAMAGEVVSTDLDYFVREIELDDQFLELDAAFPFLLTRYFTVGAKTYAAFELNTKLSREFDVAQKKAQPSVLVKKAA